VDQVKHGLRNTSEYRVWWNIKQRCCNPKNERYTSYQGMLCPQWHDAAVFCAAVGKRPTLRHTLDRIDGSKGYEPGNVRWATRRTQDRNRTDNHYVEYRGRRRALVEWCQRLDLDYKLVCNRIYRGWDAKRAITTPTGNGFILNSHKSDSFKE
jgi:hypothetical protein